MEQKVCLHAKGQCLAPLLKDYQHDAARCIPFKNDGHMNIDQKHCCLPGKNVCLVGGKGYLRTVGLSFDVVWKVDAFDAAQREIESFLFHSEFSQLRISSSPMKSGVIAEFEGKALDQDTFNEYVRKSTCVWLTDADIELVEFDATNKCIRLTCGLTRVLHVFARYADFREYKTKLYVTSDFVERPRVIADLRLGEKRLTYQDWTWWSLPDDDRIVCSYYHAQRRCGVLCLRRSADVHQFHEKWKTDWTGPLCMLMSATEDMEDVDMALQ